MQTRPRIHWVSPLPPAQTDIAAMTARILPSLAERADVVLWTDAETWDTELEAHAIVRRYDAGAHFPMPLDGLPPANGPECIFFQIGNSWLYHAGPLNLARRVPGVVVLHDLAIQDLLAGMMANGHFERSVYRAEMARWYGGAGRDVASRVLGQRLAPSEAAARMPLFEIALSKAVAALTYTEAGWDRVRERAVLPAWALDLPFAPSQETAAERASDGPLRLVQFGYLAPNRRLDQVLEALAQVKAHISYAFEVFGTLWDERHVRQKISQLGLSDRVELRGYAPEGDLNQALASAHLVFNLRNPTMGEASGSQLRIWNASAVSVVSEIGWYAGLPDDCVLKIPATGEVDALAHLLRRLDADRTICAAIGAAGRARLMERHTPERYVSGLLEGTARYGRDARDAMMAGAARALLARTPRPRLAAERLADLLED
ncbi:MAG: glycosyltransferase family 1 protein [Pseudomonadota bacterium]